MMASQDTMERIVPDQVSEDDAAAFRSLKLHMERYKFACEHLVPGMVLDIACGTGYGTWLMATYSRDFCVGVDISPETINYANERYAHENIVFICEDILKYSNDELFMNIVSLETIEHIKNPEEVIMHLSGLLLPGGRMIVSVPITPSVDANPFHVNDFTASSFRKLFKRFGMVEKASLVQKQPYSLREIFSKKRKTSGHIRRGLIGYYLSNPGKFFLRIKSLFADGLTNKYLVLMFEKPH